MHVAAREMAMRAPQLPAARPSLLVVEPAAKCRSWLCAAKHSSNLKERPPSSRDTCLPLHWNILSSYHTSGIRYYTNIFSAIRSSYPVQSGVFTSPIAHSTGVLQLPISPRLSSSKRRHFQGSGEAYTSLTAAAPATIFDHAYVTLSWPSSFILPRSLQ